MIYVYAAVAVLWLLTAGWGEYEKLRADRVQNEYDAFVVKQKKETVDTTLRWATAVQNADAGAQARLARAKEENDALEQQVSALKHGNVVLSGALSDVLQHAGSRTTTSDTGTQPSGKDTAVAISAGPQAYDEAELGKFVADAREAYESARNAWQACVEQYEGIRIATKGST